MQNVRFRNLTSGLSFYYLIVFHVIIQVLLLDAYTQQKKKLLFYVFCTIKFYKVRYVISSSCPEVL